MKKRGRRQGVGWSSTRVAKRRSSGVVKCEQGHCTDLCFLWGNCISSLSWCCNKIPSKSILRKERLILSCNSRVLPTMVDKSRQYKHEQASCVVSTGQEIKKNGCWCSAHFSLFISPGTPPSICNSATHI